jgi:hypothetical protein
LGRPESRVIATALTTTPHASKIGFDTDPDEAAASRWRVLD